MRRCKGITVATAALLMLLSQVACAPSLVSSWKAPDATPFELRGEKVAAVVMTTEQAIRLAGEDALARQLSLQGVEGIPMYTLLPDARPGDEANARAAAERAGVVGIVVMRPVRVDKEVSSTSTYAGRTYRRYWNGYYDYGWGAPWGSGRPDLRTDTIVTIETLVYSLRDNELVWAGQSRTMNPRNVDRLIQDTAQQVVNELVRLGLVRRS